MLHDKHTFYVLDDNKALNKIIRKKPYVNMTLRPPFTLIGVLNIR